MLRVDPVERAEITDIVQYCQKQMAVIAAQK